MSDRGGRTMTVIPIPVVEFEFVVAIGVVLLLGWRFVAAGYRSDIEDEADGFSRAARVFRRCCVVLAGVGMVSVVLLVVNFEMNESTYYFWTGCSFSSKEALLSSMKENKNRFHDEYGNKLLDGILNEPCKPGDSTRITVCESRSREEWLASVRQESSFPKTYALSLRIPECSVSDLWAAPGIVEIRLRCGK